ncbi:MAG: type II toxin-antitoxin system VapC family toxin [Syntrophales bacterium]|nr:type II toxin-antitoxin system VapC family toxin [Syntrophales bacterium]
MKKETVYLDTSVISAYCDERAIERQEATVKFWEDVLPRYKVFISEIAVNELENTKDERLKKKFRLLVKDFNILKINSEIRSLANIYIEKGIFPEKYIEDALHVAVATCHEISYIVSWNFEHLVKVKTRKTVSLSNILAGYKEVEIVSPQEL